MVWRLLRRNISVWQTAGYALANFVGLSIVLCAVKFYCDVRSGEQGEDPYVTRDYIVISKKVSGIGGLLGADNGFTPDEISEIAGQPWSRRVGEFTSADFNVSASLDMGGRGMSTSLFLESVPDEFFDITPSGWSFDPESDNAVPIIISKDYLTLYNYGYAASAGVPQISEGVVGMVPIRLSVSGNGKQKWLKARVVGFSSRLNTIAVPDRFMDWANSQFGEGKPMNPGRLIIETVSPGNPKIEDFLKSHGYEAAGDKGASGAFGILMLSVWLLLQKNRDKLHSLMLLGYTPASVSRYYFIIVGAVNFVVLVGAVLVMLSVSVLWRAPLDALGMSGASPLAAIGTGVAVMVAVTAINFVAITSKVKGSFAG